MTQSTSTTTAESKHSAKAYAPGQKEPVSILTSTEEKPSS